MKRIDLFAIGIGVLASGGLFAMGRAYAGEGDRPARCSLATLDGQYLFGAPTTLFPPAFGVTEQSIATAAGFHIFNGDGTGTDFVTFSVNGIDQHVPSPVATIYTLNSDCTGTFSVKNGPNFDIFVAVAGSALSVVGTDPGLASSERDVRVGKTAP